MDYLSVAEAAKLKSCKIQYIQKLCKDGKLSCSIEINDRKRPKYQIPVSALSEDLQAKYYAQKRSEAGLEPIIETAIKQTKNTVIRAFETFTENEREQIVLWKSVLEQWQTYRNSYPGKKTEVDNLFVGKCQLEHPELKVSVDILYRKYSALKNKQYERLCENRGAWNKEKSSIPTELWEQFCYLYLSDTRPTVSRCYNLTLECAREYFPSTVASFPSLRTFDRHIKSEIP